MPAVRTDRYLTTRRSLPAAGAGGGLGAVVAACSGNRSTAAAASGAGGAAAGGPWTFTDDRKKKQILALAPSAGLTVSGVSLPQPLARYAELAGLLGADLKAATVIDAKARFQQAAETLRAAAKANGEIRMLAASASTDLLHVADPRVYPDLTYFRELGVEFVQPDKVSGGFFESLSWENADKYPADAILLDSRGLALQPADLAAKPTWTALPAVKAGQVTPWLSELRYSYTACVPLIETLATAVRGARKVA